MTGTQNHKLVLSAALMLAVFLPVGEAHAQLALPGQTALENSRGGAVALRSPGNMVGQGVFRATEFRNQARVGPTITATSRPTSIRSQFVADAIQIVFDDLNQALSGLIALFQLRAGQIPSLPANLLP